MSTHLITHYGAVGDGRTDNTLAIQAAMDAACDPGGSGHVLIPPGIFLSGTLRLRSRLHLEWSWGATLKGVADPAAYQGVSSSLPSRMDLAPWKAFLFADGCEHLRLSGPGTFDGSGDAACFQNKPDNSPERPYGLFFVACRHVAVEGLHMRNSAFWMQRYLGCDGLRLCGLDVWNHANRNNDGVDIDSSRNVVVSDCRVDSADDALCLKSEGADPCRDVTITNCILSSHASAFKLGTGSVGGFERISVNNLIIRRSAATTSLNHIPTPEGLAGLDIATTDGGALRQLLIANTIIEGVRCPIFVRLGNRLSGNAARQGYAGNGDAYQGTVGISGKGLATRPAGVLEDVVLSQITARDVGPAPVIIAGHPGGRIRRMTLRDVTIISGTPGSQADLDTPPTWDASGYPLYTMFGSNLPAHGLFTGEVDDLVVENFRAIPAQGDPRPARCTA